MYLLKHIDRVGVFHTLTIYDYCLNHYIPIVVDSFETKGLIKFINKLPDGKYSIKVLYENKLLKSNCTFYEQELIDKVKSLR